MSGKKEAVLYQYESLMSLLEFAVKSYIPEKLKDKNNELYPRQKIFNNTLRTMESLTYRDKVKESLDRVHCLDSDLINRFMLMYGKDISGVKIHTGPYAECLTGNVGADALTNGQDVYFSPGSYNPQTDEGHSLLLHEVTHVNQFEEKKRMTYREDKKSAEQEACCQEGLIFLNTDETELFERLKDDSLIFRNQVLQTNYDNSEKDLEEFTRCDRPLKIHYHSQSGRVYELNPDEYKDGLKIIKERLKTDLETVLLTGSDQEKMKCINSFLHMLLWGNN